MQAGDSTQRFSDRVADYLRWRPPYPPEIVGFLVEQTNLTREWAIADLGSGTGLTSRLFLDHGNRIFGVEPNREMRQAAEELFAENPLFTSVAGSAEETTLAARSVELVAAGQAFHWFDPDRARAELERILKPGGWVTLIWNDRRKTSTPLLRAYEELLQTWAIDYREVDHTRIGGSEIESFFAPGGIVTTSFDNRQSFDCEGFEGRLLSSSYAPAAGHPSHEPMIESLRSIFDTHQTNGQVTIEYDTRVYLGRLGKSGTGTNSLLTPPG
ncbi:MAG: class I SAM-dependent methyltransferase [Thermoanaerobaculia bacterium]